MEKNDLERIEAALDAALPQEGARPAALSAAMRWAVMGGGSSSSR